MNRVELEEKISIELKDRKDRALNRNAVNALFGAFSNPLAALGQLFLGRENSVDFEKHKIERECILDLLCSIDDAIVKMQRAAVAQGVTIDGLIETYAENVDHTIGVHITEDAGATHFSSGTHIKTTSLGGRSAVGLKIGGKPEDNEG